MKIAILTPTFSKFSGIDRVVELQARELSKKNEVTILTLKADMKPSKGVKLIKIGCPNNQFLERIYRLFFFLDIFKIRKAARYLQDYDMTISHNYPMNLISIEAKKYGVKYRFHNHGVATPSLFNNKVERTYLHIFNWLCNRSIRKADEAVSISRYLQQVLKDETGIDSEIEHDEIDKKRFNKKAKGKQIRRKYQLKDETLLLYTGRISPHKGVHTLIDIFKLVKQKIPNSKLLIVGKHTFSEYSTKLKEMADEDVIFVGYVNDKDLPKYYAACDIYTTATLWEGFNLTIAEANACGKPVVAFDIGAHTEVIKKGALVEPHNNEIFAKAVCKLIKKRRS